MLPEIKKKKKLSKEKDVQYVSDYNEIDAQIMETPQVHKSLNIPISLRQQHSLLGKSVNSESVRHNDF